MVLVDEIIRESKMKKISEQLEELNKKMDKFAEMTAKITAKLDIINDKLVNTYTTVMRVESRINEVPEPTQAQLEEGKPDRRGRGKNRKIIEE